MGSWAVLNMKGNLMSSMHELFDGSVIGKDTPLPPKRVRHRGDKIDQKGRVSALCFPTPRAIDMKRATWVMSDEAVTCPKCRALIDARSKTPNVAVERAR